MATEKFFYGGMTDELKNPPPTWAWVFLHAVEAPCPVLVTRRVTEAFPQWYTTENIDKWLSNATLPILSIKHSELPLRVKHSTSEYSTERLNLVYPIPQPTGTIADYAVGSKLYMYTETGLTLISILLKHDPSKPAAWK